MYKKYFIYSRLKAELTNVICGLTAKKPGSAPCPTLVVEYGNTLLHLPAVHGNFLPLFIVAESVELIGESSTSSPVAQSSVQYKHFLLFLTSKCLTV